VLANWRGGANILTVAARCVLYCELPSGGTMHAAALGNVMRMRCLAKWARLFLAGGLLQFAADGVKADAVPVSALPDRGHADLTFFSFPLGGTAEAPSPVKSTRSSEPPHINGGQLPGPSPMPPMLVRNPFLPAAR